MHGLEALWCVGAMEAASATVLSRDGQLDKVNATQCHTSHTWCLNFEDLGVAVKNRKEKPLPERRKQTKQTASVYLVQRKSQKAERVSCVLDASLSSSTPLSPSKA